MNQPTETQATTLCPKTQEENPDPQESAEETAGYRLELYDDAGGDMNVWLFDEMPYMHREELDPATITFDGFWRGNDQEVTFVIPRVHSWALIPIDEEQKKNDPRWTNYFSSSGD